VQKQGFLADFCRAGMIPAHICGTPARAGTMAGRPGKVWARLEAMRGGARILAAGGGNWTAHAGAGRGCAREMAG